MFFSSAKSTNNYYEFFILPNGSLFISEPLFQQLMSQVGMEAIVFLILNEIHHVIKSHHRENLHENKKYGDLRKQLFFFQNQYTGFDALFIDYYTNTRFKIS